MYKSLYALLLATALSAPAAHAETDIASTLLGKVREGVEETSSAAKADAVGAVEEKEKGFWDGLFGGKKEEAAEEESEDEESADTEDESDNEGDEAKADEKKADEDVKKEEKKAEEDVKDEE